MADDKQPTFAERCERMYGIQDELNDIVRALEVTSRWIGDEAERMEAAKMRFAERRADTRKTRR